LGAVTVEFGIPPPRCVRGDPMERVEETGQTFFPLRMRGKAVELKALDCCRSCYDRQYRSRRLFGGLRDRALKRDGYRCRGCGSRFRLLVHHRDKRNEEELLLTLCIGCYMRVHHSYGFRHWLPAMLLRLWREWHEGEPVQLQLPLEWTAEEIEASSAKRVKRTQVPISPSWMRDTANRFAEKITDRN
jgi:hypothetical protein